MCASGAHLCAVMVVLALGCGARGANALLNLPYNEFIKPFQLNTSETFGGGGFKQLQVCSDVMNIIVLLLYFFLKVFLKKFQDDDCCFCV